MLPRGRPAAAVTLVVIAVVALVALGLVMATQVSDATSFHVKDPSIGPKGALVMFPSDYAKLSAHVLQLINTARAEVGVPPVALSTEPSGQQHADSMLYFGYFSHWDVQGYKPYMRYSLVNGSSAVFENVGWSHFPTQLFFGTSSALSGVDNLHYEMMYDDAFDGWGHRTTILDPNHNAVSIGVAYNTTDLYLVEDFQNSYGNLTASFQASSGIVNITGTLVPDTDPVVVQVYYDPPLKQVSPFQLMTDANYTGPYTPGTDAGTVFPTCSLYCPAKTGPVGVSADVWNQTGGLSISFSIHDFVAAMGPGVFTLYVENRTGTVLTSLSVFVDAQG
jgi:uncharacterized protein YkwD